MKLTGDCFIDQVRCTSDYRTYYNMDKFPILVHIPQRVVHGIAVTIEVLGQVRHLDKRIRSEETTQSRVIQAGVHIYQAKLLKMLMATVATTKEQLYLLPRRDVNVTVVSRPNISYVCAVEFSR